MQYHLLWYCTFLRNFTKPLDIQYYMIYNIIHKDILSINNERNGQYDKRKNE